MVLGTISGQEGLESPVDGDLGGGAFAARTGPDVVASEGAGVVGEFEDVEVDAVVVGESGEGAGVGAGAG